MDIKSSYRGVAGSLSNFTARRFVFDGVECASSEGLLQSLKFSDLEIQREVCMLVGADAKQRGGERNTEWKERQILWWLGVEYSRESAEYQRLLDRVYETLAALSDFQNDLLLTGEEILTHSIGNDNPKETILTEQEFCSRLMKNRERLRRLKG